jgi:hypothetical protein
MGLVVKFCQFDKGIGSDGAVPHLFYDDGSLVRGIESIKVEAVAGEATRVTVTFLANSVAENGAKSSLRIEPQVAWRRGTDG